MQRRRQLLHLLLHQRSQVKLLQQLHKLLRQKLRLLRQQHLLHRQLRSHHVWVHLVVQFRLLQAVVVQFRHLLVAQVERRVLVVRQWVAVLLAQVLVAKYADHLPLYRQSQIYRRVGVDLHRSTLADWVGQSSALLRPLVDSLARHVMDGVKVHADDTPVSVLDPGRGRTKIARLWAYVRDDRPAAGPAPPAVWFQYTPDRKGEHPVKHLREFHGILQADGYAGVNALYEPTREAGVILEAACWAHVRRKFYEIHEDQKRLPGTLASQALQHLMCKPFVPVLFTP